MEENKRVEEKPGERAALEGLDKAFLINEVLRLRRQVEALQATPAPIASSTPSKESSAAVEAAPVPSTALPAKSVEKEEELQEEKAHVAEDVHRVAKWGAGGGGALGEIPGEVVLMMLGYLAPRELLGSFGALSKSCHALAQSDSVWKGLFYSWYANELLEQAEGGASLAANLSQEPLPPFSEYNLQPPEGFLKHFRAEWEFRKRGSIHLTGAMGGRWLWNGTHKRLTLNNSGRVYHWDFKNNTASLSGVGILSRLSFMWRPERNELVPTGMARTTWRISPKKIFASGPITGSWDIITERPNQSLPPVFRVTSTAGGRITRHEIHGNLPLPLVALVTAAVHEKQV